MKPLAIDLFCGMGGWTRGLQAAGWRVVGFDIERWPEYPGELILQDVRTLDGAQFASADLIVASPPCQEYSYMAMPWKRAKQIAGALREECPFPEGYSGSRTLVELNALFDACFRIQRESSEAKGQHIPMVVENVKGAQPWVGRAQANFGSYYLWGDVGMAGKRIVRPRPQFGEGLRAPGRATNKGWGGTWFHNAETGRGNPNRNRTPIPPDEQSDGQKVPGFNFHQHEKGGTGGSFQSAAVNGVKATRNGKEYGGDFGWDGSPLRQGNSRSAARKHASAVIAKIPFPLAEHVGRVYFPTGKTAGRDRQPYAGGGVEGHSPRRVGPRIRDRAEGFAAQRTVSSSVSEEPVANPARQLPVSETERSSA